MWFQSMAWAGLGTGEVDMAPLLPLAFVVLSLAGDGCSARWSGYCRVVSIDIEAFLLMTDSLIWSYIKVCINLI